MAMQDIQGMRQKFFANRRGQALQQANASQQEGDDAIQRRFTSMGAAGTGANIAAMQKQREANDNLKRQSMADVDAMELQAREGDIGRQFQLDENERNRGFQSGEADKGRGFQREMAGQDLGFKREVFGAENKNKLSELDLARQQFELDRETTLFNRGLASAEAGAGPDKSALMRNVEGVGQAVGNQVVGGLVGGAVGQVVGGIKTVLPNVELPKVDIGGTWICTKVDAVDPLSIQDHEALKKFRVYGKVHYPDFASFYIYECKELMERMDQKVNWKDFSAFVRNSTSLVKNGDFETATILYMDKVFQLVEEYWPDCDHPYWLDIKSIAA